MFTSWYLNIALKNSIHKGALRLIYNDYELPFDWILEDKAKMNASKKYSVIIYL